MGRRVALRMVPLVLSKTCDGFVHSINIRVARTLDHILPVKREGNDISDRPHRWKHEPFDFSSKLGWDKFYEKGLQNVDDSMEISASEIEDADAEETMESLEYEWHGHIPHSAIVDAIKPAISAASRHYSRMRSASRTNDLPSILLVGCGNSALPRILHDGFDSAVQVTCLDYSPVCIDMIKSMYQSSCPNMDFVVGDATNLQQVQWDEDTAKQSSVRKSFDVVVDKGLLDALMCGEGFDLERLMGSVNDVLTHREWGLHVLICFQLSKASKQCLAEFGDSESEPNLVWNFDIPVEGSENGRACFNLALRCEGRYNDNLGIGQKITTEWI